MTRLKIYILLLFSSINLYAQLPNDCVNAIVVCGNGNFSSNATGFGVQEVAGCSGFEHNSIWIKINIVATGTLGFNLVPNDPSILVDYDFWVYGPNVTCGSLGSPIRCCTTNPNLAGLSSNVTGMIGTTLATTSGPGANGNGFVKWLDVIAGQSYYIAIDRPVGDGGFDLQWTGSTMDAGGAFPTPPVANSISELRVCSSTPNVGIFNLNAARSLINPDLVNNTITFHTTLANAIDGVSPLPNIYANTSNPQTIYAKVKNNTSGCSSTTTFLLRVLTTPDANISVSPTSVCPNDTATVTFTGTPGAVVEYKINGGPLLFATLDGSGNFQITGPIAVTTVFELVRVKTLDTDNVTVLCSKTKNTTATVTVNSLPAPTAVSNSPICFGATATFTVTGTPNAIFNYTIDGGANQTGTLNSSGQYQINLPGLPAGSHTLLISSITDANPPNCTTPTSVSSVVVVEADLTANVSASGAICSGTSTTVNFTGTPNATITYMVNGGSNQTITLNNSGTASVTTGALTTNQTYQLIDVFTTVPACSKTVNNATTITIVAQPTVTSFTGTTSICSGSSTNLSFVGTANATVTYFDGTSNLTVVLNNVGNATVPVSPTSTTTYSLVSIEIPSSPVCSNTATGNVVITITPDNTVTAASATPTLCINTPLTSFTHNTTGATGIGAAIGLPTGVTASWGSNQITITGTPSVAGTFAYSIPLTGGCGTVNATGIITVNPDNTVTAASSTPTLCVNTSLTPITHNTTGATGIGSPTGLPTGVTATWSSNQITINGIPTATGTFVYSIPLTGGCGAVNATGTITVNPDNTVTTASATPTLCENALLTPITHSTTGATGIGTATGLPNGVSATWATNTITISGTPTTAGIYNYSIPLTGGCGGIAIGTITVLSTNTVTVASATPTICVNVSFTPSITHNTTGATGIGAPTGLPTGITASWASNQITISGTPTVTGIFNYSIPLTGGCGSVNATGMITVNPNNTVAAASATPTLCVNTALTPITHATTGATGIGSATGLPAGVLATWASNTITISGTPTASGMFSYSIPVTGGCGTFNATGTIIVIPSNTVTTASSNPALCVNTLLTPITHTTTGATGIGTTTGLPTGVNASWASNTITISGTPTTSGVFNYTIALTGGCGNVNATGTITVSPAPANIGLTGGTTICAGTSATLVVTATPGTVITWNGTPSSFTIGASGSNNIIVSPAINTTYTLTSASLNGCLIPLVPGTPATTTTVGVSATPQFVTQVPDITICNGGRLNIKSQLTSTVPGATFGWNATYLSVVGTDFTTGLPISIGDENNIDQIVTLSNSLQEGVITIIVTPKIGTCSGTPQTIIVTVKPVPQMSAVTAAPLAVCNNGMVTITPTSSPLASSYNWQINAANTTNVQIAGGATSGTVNGAFQLQLFLTDASVSGTISFDFTPTNGTCTGSLVQNTVTITVNPIPGTPIPSLDKEICSGGDANLIITSDPNIIGTRLEWTVIDSQNVTGFVETGISTTEVLEIHHTLINESDVQGYVRYSVTAKMGNCNGGTTEYLILVNPKPKPTLIDGHICVNEDTGVTYQNYILDAQLSNPFNIYNWSVLNTTSGLFEPLATTSNSTYSVSTPGTYQVVVTNTDTGCVSDPDQATVITVYPATAFTTIVTDAFLDSTTITVTVNPIGNGNLIYSLDGGAWQSSNVFTGVEAGPHKIMVEDVEGCTNLTQPITVIDYPKYFTPNGDGIHDTWNIVGLDQADAKLYIFDRYGKLIKQISTLDGSKGWDGTYNGQQVPSTDYWFTIEYLENNQQKQFKSHFSLKR